MSSVDIYMSTLGCVLGQTSRCGPNKRIRSARGQEYATYIEENRHSAKVAKEKVIEMEYQIKDLQEEQKRTNELLKPVMDKMEYVNDSFNGSDQVGMLFMYFSIL